MSSSVEVCRRAKKPSVPFDGLLEQAFATGTERQQKWAGFMRGLTNFLIFFNQCGACMTYIITIGKNLKAVCDPTFEMNARIWVAAVVPVVLILNLAGTIRFATFIAFFGNINLFTCISIVLYYVMIGGDKTANPSIPAENFKPIQEWALFLSTTMYAIQAVAMIMLIENSMKKPERMIGCCSVLNTATILCTTMCCLVGFFGYKKYGGDVGGSITLNLPKEPLAAVAQVLISLSVLCSTPLYLMLPTKLVYQTFYEKIICFSSDAGKERLVRVLITLVIGTLAIAVPNIRALIGLVGSISVSFLALISPAILEFILRWSTAGAFRRFGILLKNGIILIIACFCVVLGTYDSVLDIYEKFGFKVGIE